MTRISITLALLVAIAIISCKKSTSTSPSVVAPPPGIRATINGVAKSFKIRAFASKTVYPDGVININAEATLSDSTGEYIVIGIDNYNRLNVYDPITTGIYSDTSLHYEAELYYTTDGDITNYQGGSNYDGSGYVGTDPVFDHLIVTVTTLNDTSLIGTFNGNAYFGGIAANAHISVTNGTFNVKF